MLVAKITDVRYFYSLMKYYSCE